MRGCPLAGCTTSERSFGRALNQAMRWGLVMRNAAALTEPFRQESYEVEPLSATDARAVMAAAEGDRLDALFTVALGLGCGRGRCLD